MKISGEIWIYVCIGDIVLVLRFLPEILHWKDSNSSVSLIS